MHQSGALTTQALALAVATAEVPATQQQQQSAVNARVVLEADAQQQLG